MSAVQTAAQQAAGRRGAETMRAAVFERPGRSALQARPMPECGHNDAIVPGDDDDDLGADCVALDGAADPLDQTHWLVADGPPWRDPVLAAQDVDGGSSRGVQAHRLRGSAAPSARPG
jgi:hypothetical protein